MCEAFTLTFIHDFQCWQNESSTSSADKSRGYHRSAAIYRSHLLWVNSIVKLAQQSCFHQVFHVIRPRKLDITDCVLESRSLCPPTPRQNTTSGRDFTLSVCLGDYTRVYDESHARSELIGWLQASRATTHPYNWNICFILSREEDKITYLLGILIPFVSAKSLTKDTAICVIYC